MNNLMSDIQNGFVHRRLPDGGFKVLEVTCFCLALSKSDHSTLEVKLEGVKVSVEYYYNSDFLKTQFSQPNINRLMYVNTKQYVLQTIPGNDGEP